MEECYLRHQTTQNVNGVLETINRYRRVEAGVVTDILNDFITLGVMPDGWEPGEEDLLIHDVTEEMSNTLGYMREQGTSNLNGVISVYTKYYHGLINVTLRHVFMVDEFEFMPDGWEPIPGTHKILYEDVIDPLVYE
ncbi:hypothetical protein ELBI_92 [Anabaena phage Elbi]|nr:hypothetical protein ELBI_92 [Anabaena phage Elbi]